MKQAIRENVKNMGDQIIAWRREIHRHPELGLDCGRTAALVSAQLQAAGLEVQSGLAQSGVVGILRGEKPGPVVALRVDMDALPIAEQTGLPFASARQGVMHACGHDGHTAMGLGAATVLSRLRHELRGTVKFIFQPGEESPGGAKLMIKEGVLEDPKVEALFGCHIFPGVRAGHWGVRYGTMTASDDEFDITISGVGGHGAYPHKGVDPIAALGYFLVGVQSIVARSNDPVQPLVISVTEVSGGQGHNVIPGEVRLKGTIRSTEADSREMARRRLSDLLEGLKLSQQITYSLRFVAENPALVCDPKLTRFAEKTLREVFGEAKVVSIAQPSLGAEDFAYFAGQVPAAYLRIGCYDQEAGRVHQLHTPYFDFEESILIEGSAGLACLLFDYAAQAGNKTEEI